MRGYEVGRVDGLVDKGWGEGGEDGMGERVDEGVNVCVCITSSRLFTANSQFFQEHEGGWVPL